MGIINTVLSVFRKNKEKGKFCPYCRTRKEEDFLFMCPACCKEARSMSLEEWKGKQRDDMDVRMARAKMGLARGE